MASAVATTLKSPFGAENSFIVIPILEFSTLNLNPVGNLGVHPNSPSEQTLDFGARP
jgi:hypothetical protein